MKTSMVWQHWKCHQRKTVEKIFLSWKDFGLYLIRSSNLSKERNNSLRVSIIQFHIQNIDSIPV